MKLDLVTIGTPLIDVLSAKKGKIIATGGSATTTAAVVSWLGLKSGVIGYIGKDYYGDYILSELGKFCVDTTRLRRNGRTCIHHITSAAKDRYFTKEEHGENYGRPRRLGKSDLAYISQSRSVFSKFSNYSFSQMLRFCERGGVGVFTSLQKTKFNKNIFATQMLDSPAIKVIFANEKEVGKSVLKLEDKLIIVTRGGKGSSLHYGGVSKNYPPFKAKTVDTTGAGDVFAGAFLFNYLRDPEDTDYAMRFANMVAAMSTAEYGSRALLHKLQPGDLFRMLQNKGLNLNQKNK